MRDGKKYRIINLILDTDDNPTTWTDEEKAIRAEKRKDKEISKAQALLAALMNSVEA